MKSMGVKMAKKKKVDRIKGTGDLSERIGQTNTELVINKVIEARKVKDDGSRLTDEDGVEFDEVTHEFSGTKLFVQPRHVTIDDVSEHANSKCRDCNTKGYMISNIAKTSLRNPSLYVILSTRSLSGMTDEEKKQVIEEERKSSTWRVLLPCHCALKGARKKIPNFFANNDGSVMFALEWEEEKLEEPA